MIGYVRYRFIHHLPVGIKVDLDDWAHNEPEDDGNEWAKVCFNIEDVKAFSFSDYSIRRGIILELA